MDNMALLGAGLAAAAIIVIALGVAMSGSGSGVSERLQRYASTAKLMSDIRGTDAAVKAGAVARYLELLRAGGSDHPMKLLQRAGVDLSQPETVRAVAVQLDDLITSLERELA